MASKILAGANPASDPSIETSRDTVNRLMVELRDALAACHQGPLRATIDSDGHAVVQSLQGIPWVKGARIVGVPMLMVRDVCGPTPYLLEADSQEAVR